MDDYRCMCVEGFIGTDCETNRDECATAPCLNGATCAVSSKTMIYYYNSYSFFQASVYSYTVNLIIVT